MASNLVAMASTTVVQLAMASDLLAGASSIVTSSPVLRSCILFTHFCFELAFSVNMKVLYNYVSFPVALVLLENEF